MRLARLVTQQVGRAFHGVARGMQNLDFHVADLEIFAVGGRMGLKFRERIGSKHNGRAGLFRKGQVTRHKIGVEVGFQHVFDGGPARLRQIEVRLDLTEGVHNGDFSIALDVVRALGKATGVNLLDFHGMNFEFKSRVGDGH